MRRSMGAAACLCAGALLAPVAGPANTASAAEEAPLRATLSRKWERLALKEALSGAARRLERPACQKVFSDFRDARGRTLQEGLEATGMTGADFLQRGILFADGRHEKRCLDPRVMALTEPGSRAVWICGIQFFRQRRSDPEDTELLLIHEALHALGLGEDPPSSAAISRRVFERCRD